MSITELPPVAGCRLWQVDLDTAPAPRTAAALSAHEGERARRFVFERDGDRFVAVHAALRDALSQLAGIPAALLDFTQGPFGKPALAQPSTLRFNLSHCQSVALIAVCEQADVGADVELLRAMPDADALALACFTGSEHRALCEVAPEARDRAFLTCWTRKEACLKATGTGLSIDTRSFEVGIAPDDREIELVGVHGVLRLALSSFVAAHGAVCAVARVLPAEAALASSPAAETGGVFA
ncbi:MAG: 4'-phosphopantetheinyl transferase superfamily protein [Variovorax sp.]